MFDFDERDSASPSGTDGRFTDSQTDRVNGEYHYKNGYTQKIYSDAHYIPEDETTVPPRYYTPPEKSTKEINPATVRTIKLILTYVMCALLGGTVGAALIDAQNGDKLAEMDSRLTAMQELISEKERESALEAQAAAESSPMPASVIYDLACRQVVSVTVDDDVSDSGTGFILSSDGYIVTSYHSVEAASGSRLPLSVRTKDGSIVSAELVGADENSGLAVLKTSVESAFPAVLGSSDRLLTGDTVYAVSNLCAGLECSMSTAHVAGLSRSIKLDDDVSLNAFQLDIPVTAACPGAPVYNDHGEIVGVIAYVGSDDASSSACLVLPMSEAYPKICRLISTGHVTGQAALGLTVDSRYSAVYSQYFGIPMGAYVLSVNEGSCSERAGIQAGDVITAIGDDAVTSAEELRAVLRHYSAGDTATVKIFRTDGFVELGIVFDELAPEH